jgi:hypothetical protein
MPENPFKKFQNFRTSSAVEGKTRTVLIIIMLVAVLGIGILAAFLGSKMGDEEGTECPKDCEQSKIEKGWKAFSITIIALGIPLLVVSFIFFGCTTKVADAAWSPK